MEDIEKELAKLANEFGVDKKRNIIDAAKEIGVKPYLIRFWEDNFTEISAKIENKKRYYYNFNIDILKKIKFFLIDRKLEIKDLQNLIKTKKIDLKDDIENLQNIHTVEEIDLDFAKEIEKDFANNFMQKFSDIKINEFNKKIQKIEEQKISIEDFINKEIFLDKSQKNKANKDEEDLKNVNSFLKQEKLFDENQFIENKNNQSKKHLTKKQLLMKNIERKIKELKFLLQN